MLFEASDTCAPACPALHTVTLLLPPSLPRSEISLPRAIPPLPRPAKRYNVRRRPATASMWKAHGNVRSMLHVTYGVSCIKMQTMIRTTLRSHAPTIHSPADVWTVVVYRSSRAASRSRAASTRWAFLSRARYLFGENAHRDSSTLIMDQRRGL